MSNFVSAGLKRDVPHFEKKKERNQPSTPILSSSSFLSLILFLQPTAIMKQELEDIKPTGLAGDARNHRRCQDTAAASSAINSDSDSDSDHVVFMTQFWARPPTQLPAPHVPAKRPRAKVAVPAPLPPRKRRASAKAVESWARAGPSGRGSNSSTVLRSRLFKPPPPPPPLPVAGSGDDAAARKRVVAAACGDRPTPHGPNRVPDDDNTVRHRADENASEQTTNRSGREKTPVGSGVLEELERQVAALRVRVSALDARGVGELKELRTRVQGLEGQRPRVARTREEELLEELRVRAARIAEQEQEIEKLRAELEAAAYRTPEAVAGKSLPPRASPVPSNPLPDAVDLSPSLLRSLAVNAHRSPTPETSLSRDPNPDPHDSAKSSPGSSEHPSLSPFVDPEVDGSIEVYGMPLDELMKTVTMQCLVEALDERASVRLLSTIFAAVLDKADVPQFGPEHVCSVFREFPEQIQKLIVQTRLYYPQALLDKIAAHPPPHHRRRFENSLFLRDYGASFMLDLCASIIDSLDFSDEYLARTGAATAEAIKAEWLRKLSSVVSPPHSSDAHTKTQKLLRAFWTALSYFRVSHGKSHHRTLKGAIIPVLSVVDTVRYALHLLAQPDMYFSQQHLLLRDRVRACCQILLGLQPSEEGRVSELFEFRYHGVNYGLMNLIVQFMEVLSHNTD